MLYEYPVFKEMSVSFIKIAFGSRHCPAPATGEMTGK